MKLRRSVILAGAGGMLLPSRVLAQERVWRIGWLSSIDSFKEPYSLALVQRLQEIGFVDGRNLKIEFRHADGKLDRLPAVAGELVRLKPDVFFGGGTESTLVALVAASRDTPIVVVATDYDPVATGHVTNLARPGGRITGVTPLQSVLPAKRLELLKELLPAARKVAVFTTAGTAGQLEVTQDAARRLGLALQVIEFRREPFDYEAAFADAVRGKADALIVLGSALFVPARRRIPEMATRAKLPTMFHQAQWAEVGGLASYGFSFSDMYRRAADQVAAILRGAKAGDIPMEQGSKFELAINLRTAKALGLAVPQSIMLRADRVIE